MLKEIKEFAMRGNVIDMAVGIIMGAAFGAIVNSFVKDMVMPPVGLLLGGVDFENLYWLLQAGSPAPPYASLVDAQAAGAVTVNYGVFINLVITFLIVTVVMFLLVRVVNRLRQSEAKPPAEPATRECPYCLSAIPIKARRCAYCTSELEP